MFSMSKELLVSAENALPGRTQAMSLPPVHLVTGTSMMPPFPAGNEAVRLGMGCFWGPERRLLSQPGIYTTAVGYAGGFTPNPSYREVCSGMTGHTEVVLVVYDPIILPLRQLLAIFWEAHDPTQGMGQGNDRGTQYRSAVYVGSAEQLQIAQTSAQQYQAALKAAGLGEITTEIRLLEPFYYAEEYHQQYLAKNPDGYCGLQGTGVSAAQ